MQLKITYDGEINKELDDALDKVVKQFGYKFEGSGYFFSIKERESLYIKNGQPVNRTAARKTGCEAIFKKMTDNLCPPSLLEKIKRIDGLCRKAGGELRSRQIIATIIDDYYDT